MRHLHLKRTLYELQDRYNSAVTELDFSRRENQFLKDTQAHTQSLLRETSAQLSGGQLDQRIQGACSQAFLATQKSFTSLLETVAGSISPKLSGTAQRAFFVSESFGGPLQTAVTRSVQHYPIPRATSGRGL